MRGQSSRVLPSQDLEGRTFLVGEAFGIADIALVAALTQLTLVTGPIDADRWPNVAAHYDRVIARPSFQPSLEIARKIVSQPPVDLRA